MITLSLCMIVKNEEDTLERCLNTIKDIADEIIIVDTGSTDKTKEIAKEFTDNIYDFEWVDDFSAARNFSFSKATKDYIMWLDADDVILSEDRKKLKDLKDTLSDDIDTIIMRYNLTRKETGEVICSFYRERIVKRINNFQWQDPVHEYILYGGQHLKTDIAVTHKKIHSPTTRNLDIFEKYIKNGNELSQRNWFYYARELFNVGEKEKAAVYFNKFLETEDGLISNYLDSCIELSEYYDEIGDDINCLKTLLKFFEKGSPRAEICCKLGYYYKKRNDYQKAIDWFSIAPNTRHPDSLGAVMPQFWDYIPFMEMSLCSYKLGNIDDAIMYNEKAAQENPNDSKVLHNRSYLAVAKEKLTLKNNNIDEKS